MIVKTPGSQMDSSAAAEEGGEAMGGGRGESGESSEVHERLSVTLKAPKARSRLRGVATLDEAPRISLRVSSKLPTLSLSLLSLVITALARTLACPSTTVAFTPTSVSNASWGEGSVHAGYVDAFLAAALTRVMRAAVPIPAVPAASVLHSSAVGGSVVGVVRPI